MQTFHPHLRCALQVLAASLMPLTTACMTGAPEADNGGLLDGGAEILMDKNGASNVALSGTATQSSIAYNGSPARAIDGDTSGRWGENSVTHTAQTAAPWWRVDLSNAHRVDRVTLWNRTDCCSARLSNFHVDYLGADGNVIVSQNHPGQAGPTTEIMLSASGVHAVRVQLYGTNPLSLAEVQVWGAPDSGVVSNGLVGTYFDNADLTTQKATRVDSTVNFNWGTGSPTTAIANSTFSVRWTGFVRAQYSQTYTFYTLTDDGVRLWVNNQLIVNDWTNHPSKEYRGTIALQAGKAYSITMEYYDNAGSAVATLSWSSATQVKQVIPQAQLFTGDPSTDQCPTDSNKTLPGLCGCGVSDADSDRDGMADCKDGCKTDSNKTEPGACGCSVPEGSCQSGFVSRMVNYDANGQLRYSTDAEGNRIPDFSYVGYKYGEELPSTSNLVPANQIKTIGPIAGDNTAHIQSAIDAVGAYPVQSNGYRGIVRLKPGTYLLRAHVVCSLSSDLVPTA